MKLSSEDLGCILRAQTTTWLEGELARQLWDLRQAARRMSRACRDVAVDDPHDDDARNYFNALDRLRELVREEGDE